MELEFGLKELDTVAKEGIISLFKQYSIFTFSGPLGAGKTTLIRSILRQCGVSGVITSPTFGYVNSYIADDGTVYNHFDLYRINSVDEFIELGFEEYLSKPGCINFIEWPEVIQDLLSNVGLKSKVCQIQLEYAHDDLSRRVLKVKK